MGRWLWLEMATKPLTFAPYIVIQQCQSLIAFMLQSGKKRKIVIESYSKCNVTITWSVLFDRSFGLSVIIS